jgi:hypothetical protein
VRYGIDITKVLECMVIGASKTRKAMLRPVSSRKAPIVVSIASLHHLNGMWGELHEMLRILTRYLLHLPSARRVHAKHLGGLATNATNVASMATRILVNMRKHKQAFCIRHTLTHQGERGKTHALPTAPLGSIW